MSKSRNVGFRASADIFSEPGLEKTYEMEQEVTVFPTTNIDGEETPLEFVLNSNNLHYLNLFESELAVHVTLRDKDNAVVAGDKEMGCVNNLLGSLFSNVDVWWNDKSICPMSSYYPHKSYIKNIFTLGDKEYNTLKSSMFWKDKKPGTFTLSGNTDFKSRSDSLKTAAGIELIGKIRHPVFETNRLIPKNVSIKIRLRRSSKDFFLLAGGSASSADYTLTIDSAKLKYF